MVNNSTNTKNLIRLIRFLSRKDESGYIFAYTQKTSLINHINNEIIRNFKSNNESIGLLFLDNDSDIKITETIKNYTNGNSITALIIVNLYEYITGNNGKRHLIEINFARESLYSFKIPILFWITEETFPLISNHAADLYSQRRLPSLIFEDSIYFVPLEQAPTNYAEISNEPNEKLRLEIVEDQFNDAVKQKVNIQSLISNFLIPYILVLSKNYQKDTVLDLLNTYKENISDRNYYNIDALATIYSNIYEYSESLKYINLCIEHKNGEMSQEKLASLYERKGDIYFETGNLSKALKIFNLYHGIFHDLFHSDPLNLFFKHKFAISFEKLGAVHSSLGNTKDTIILYKNSIELMKEINYDYPQLINYKNDLGLSYSKLGSIYSILGSLDKALQYLDRSKKIFTELHNTSPNKISYKNQLAYINSRLGSVYSILGNYKKALTIFEDAKLIMEELFNDNPLNVDFKKGLAVIYERIGTIYTSLKNLNKALDCFTKQFELNQELFNDFPQGDDFKNGLAISYQKLAETYYNMEDFKKAFVFLEKRHDFSNELHEAHPENTSYKNSLATSYFNLGMFYKDEDKVKAKEYFERAIKLWWQLSNDAPNNTITKNLEYVKNMLKNL